jgi:3-oxoacyl-[acyl-carrier-protein] synthase III
MQNRRSAWRPPVRSTQAEKPTGARVAARDVATPDPVVTEAAPPSWERGRLRAATLASVGTALPERVVANAEVAQRLGVDHDWIVSRTGIHERRRVAEGEGVTELAVAAGRRALERAGMEADELDLVLVATLAPDDITPNAAPLVAHELGAVRAGALDVGAACTGFLCALSLATAQIEARRARNALVIGAEVLSRFTDPHDKRTAALFGDGAGAAVVAPAEGGTGRIGPIALRADGSGAGSIVAAKDDPYLRMQGHDTFREAVRRLTEATREAAELAAVELDHVDLFVYHQANARILSAVAERLELDPARVIDCIERYGNTSAATLPIALDEAAQRGMVASGDTVLLAAFGAGFTYGAGVITWA